MSNEFKLRHFAAAGAGLLLGWAALKITGLPIIGPFLAWPFWMGALFFLGSLILRGLMALRMILTPAD